MPVLPFEAKFLTGDWSEWHVDSGQAVYASRTGPYPTLGVSNGPTATCMYGQPYSNVNGAQFEQCITGSCFHGGSGPGSGSDAGNPTISFRMQYSIACNDLNVIDVNLGVRTLIFYCFGTNLVTDTKGLPQVSLNIMRNGSFRMYFAGGGNPGAGTVDAVPWPASDPAHVQTVYVDTSPGVIAFDGVNHAITVTLAYTGHSSLHYIATIDGTTVLDNTLVAGPYYCGGQWGQPTVGQYFGTGLPPANCLFFTCPGQYVPQSGTNQVLLQTHRRPSCGLAKLMTRVAHVSIVNTPSAYPIDTTIPVLLLNACAAIINSMVADITGKITITGIRFPDDMSVVLKGPGATTVTYDIVSRSSTQLVINNLNPPFIPGGLYCVTGPCI